MTFSKNQRMILQKEIERHAEANNVAKSTIDKDWVLGHFIDAIFSVKQCRGSLIFKGGTSLRKCYFPDYRFSEDLDFTAVDPDFVLDAPLLREICDLVTDRTKIPLDLQEISPLRSKNKPTGYKSIIKFWGADHSRNQAPTPPERWTSSIKIEIILYEQVIFPLEEREVNHPYSDKMSQNPLTVPCYSIHEILAEKLRALIQRSYTAPRDLYDIWYLSRNANGINWEEVTQAFYAKMRYKGLEFTGIDQMINEENEKRLKAAWKNSLEHQIPKENMVEYEIVKSGVVKLLNSIF